MWIRLDGISVVLTDDDQLNLENAISAAVVRELVVEIKAKIRQEEDWQKMRTAVFRQVMAEIRKTLQATTRIGGAVFGEKLEGGDE